MLHCRVVVSFHKTRPGTALGRTEAAATAATTGVQQSSDYERERQKEREREREKQREKGETEIKPFSLSLSLFLVLSLSRCAQSSLSLLFSITSALAHLAVPRARKAPVVDGCSASKATLAACCCVGTFATHAFATLRSALFYLLSCTSRAASAASVSPPPSALRPQPSALRPQTASYILPFPTPSPCDPLPPTQAVKMTSSKRPKLPYEYYYLPFCRPSKLRNTRENLGEVLRGDRITNTPYLVRVPCPALSPPRCLPCTKMHLSGPCRPLTPASLSTSPLSPKARDEPQRVLSAALPRRKLH